MNNEKLRKKVRRTAAEILAAEIVISPVDLLMRMGMLSKKDYEDWRMGKIPYLERVCRANLSKLGTAMKELKKFARENNLKPSITVYTKWGKGKKTLLRFSKSNNPAIEKAYSTHYVNRKLCVDVNFSANT
ncbi:hypothetical protein [Desulfotruncus arcticus]|uniref:hypothetical protein n=1 Tax=Desulfotruncus arcticus TaxID=341036 RepID=UPI000B8445E6|nr:hypothetical protein [Desulfotruncus arcticus]